MRPSIERLDPRLRAAARAIAERLAARGHRAWIVGGAPRDLAVGRAPLEVDLATSATPAEIESAFERTIGVGRAFGTVVVRSRGVDVQVTTFRAERGYSDLRRPDEVSFGTSVEEDARRRDFTVNAVYLDPLSGEVADPEGGLADLERGVLACVGDPRERFAEDGLRLLRLARFAASLGLEIEPATRSAARASLDALRGVSPERVRAELELLRARPGTGRGLALLHELGVLARLLPSAAARGDLERRVERAGRLPDGAPFAPWLALLLEGAPDDLERLRPSRALARRVAELWSMRARLAEVEPSDPGGRAAAIRLVREDAWPELLLLAEATGEELERARALERLRRSLRPDELRPPPLLTSDDLARAGVPRGPRWGELLRDAEDLQLAGRLRSADEARAWLGARAREAGNDP